MILQTEFVPYCPPYQQPQPQRRRRRGLKPTHKGIILWHVLLACYYLCDQFCGANAEEKDVTLVDLSHVFDNTTIYWVTAKPLTLTVNHNGTRESDGYWYQSDEISAATHGGTHMDSPCHFARGKWCVSDIPLDRLVVKAVVVDITDKVINDPDVHLTKNDLIKWERLYGEIPKSALVLIRTGWSRFWPDPLTYIGTAERGDTSLLRYPSILPEAAEWLVAERDIVGIGIDSISIDVANTIPRTHTTLAEKNIYGLENVNNLNKLSATGATVFVMPMKLKYASGAPCRIVAQVPGSMSSAQCRICSSNSVLAAVAIYFAVLFWTKLDNV